MLFYVAHKYGGVPENYEAAKKVVHNLQVNDLENTYICPLLALSHLKYNEIGFEAEINLCLDILSQCDTLIVASPVSMGVQAEIDFAKKVNMEIRYLNEN